QLRTLQTEPYSRLLPRHRKCRFPNAWPLCLPRSIKVSAALSLAACTPAPSINMQTPNVYFHYGFVHYALFYVLCPCLHHPACWFSVSRLRSTWSTPASVATAEKQTCWMSPLRWPSGCMPKTAAFPGWARSLQLIWLRYVHCVTPSTNCCARHARPDNRRQPR